MTYAGTPRPIVGPARCPACGAPVWYARRMSRQGNVNTPKARWRDADGCIHRCKETDR